MAHQSQFLVHSLRLNEEPYNWPASKRNLTHNVGQQTRSVPRSGDHFMIHFVLAPHCGQEFTFLLSFSYCGHMNVQGMMAARKRKKSAASRIPVTVLLFLSPTHMTGPEHEVRRLASHEWEESRFAE